MRIIDMPNRLKLRRLDRVVVRRKSFALGVVAALLGVTVAAPFSFAEPAPESHSFGSAAISVRWHSSDERVDSMVLTDHVNQRDVAIVSLFALTLRSGEKLDGSQLRLLAPITEVVLKADTGASREAERLPGRAV